MTAHHALQQTLALESWPSRFQKACSKHVSQIEGRLSNHSVNTQKRIVTGRGTKPLVFGPESHEVENICFDSVPRSMDHRSQNQFVKTSPLTTSHPRIRHICPDQFLTPHAHFQDHMGWGKLCVSVKVVFNVYVRWFSFRHNFWLVNVKDKCQRTERLSYCKFSCTQSGHHRVQNLKDGKLCFCSLHSVHYQHEGKTVQKRWNILSRIYPQFHVSLYMYKT